MGQEKGEKYHKVHRWAGMCIDESLDSELWETETVSELPHLRREKVGLPPLQMGQHSSS